MKGKHCKRRSFWHGFGPRTNGALLGLAVIGVAAGVVQATDAPDDTGSAVAAVNMVPKPQTAEHDAAAKTTGKPEDKPAKKDERSEVIERARTWHPHTAQRVPYSQVRSHNGYRSDCSGFVSMALGLPKPGPNTVGLTSPRLTKRIKMSELKKGDLVMDAEGTNTTRHVVIFERWANAKRTSYWAYEQRGHYGTDHRTLDYGLSSRSEFKAYRPVKLSDA